MLRPRTSPQYPPPPSWAQIEFGCGNPQYVASVRNGLLCLLSSTHLPAQRIAAQVINGFISPESPSHIPAELFNYPAAFVPSIIAMLSSEVSVRYEALNMLQQLVRARASLRLRARRVTAAARGLLGVVVGAQPRYLPAHRGRARARASRRQRQSVQGLESRRCRGIVACVAALSRHQARSMPRSHDADREHVLARGEPRRKQHCARVWQQRAPRRRAAHL